MRDLDGIKDRFVGRFVDKATDEDISDGIRARIFAVLKKPVTYAVVVGVLVIMSPVMMWQYGFVPTTTPQIMEYKGAPAGTITVATLRDMIKSARAHGWVANDLLWPRIVLPYRYRFEVGEWNAWQQITYNLKFNLSREGRSDRIDRNLINANSAINNSAEKWWFPSAESKMDEAIAALDAYLATLPTKQNFYLRATTLYALIDGFASTLGGSMADLADNPDVGFLQGYDPFHYAKGQVYVVSTMLKAVQIEFADVLVSKRGSAKQLEDAIHWLDQALSVSPLIVSNGEWNVVSDLSTLANRISKAQQFLVPLADTLRNG